MRRNSRCRGFSFCDARVLLVLLKNKNKRNCGGRKMRGVHPIDKEKFYNAYNMCIRGEMSMNKATKYIGISFPTLRKYFNMVYRGEKLPDTLFGRRDPREQE